jgi:hypothetical protein
MQKYITKKLQELQAVLKCGKGNYNAFGKYGYRSIEDICEAIKPFLANIKVCFLMDDEVKLIGERFYVESTITILCSESGERISVRAQAREPNDKKGMDASQLTGATATYARKRAFQGLLLLDNNEDADSLNKHEDDKKSSNNKTKEDDLL